MENIQLYLPTFLLVITRLSSFFMTAPLFSYRTISNRVKVGLAFFFSLVITSSMNVKEISINGEFFFLIMREMLIGMSIGLLAFIILSAIQIAGGFIDFQMGFAIANVMDPQTGAQSPLVGQYLYVFAILIMLAVNGHHMMLDGIYYSYQIIPLTSISLDTGQLAEFVLKAFNSMFIIAFQMSIPIVGSLFLVDLALGVVARTVPQLNIFVVGLPLKLLVSLGLIIVSMSTFGIVLQNVFKLMIETMRGLMQIIGGV